MLKAAGAGLALPWLESYSFAGGEPRPPRRMVAIQTTMGILPQYFFPQSAGRDYELTPYLQLLADFRDDFTLLSGVSHPQVDGGHQAELSFLTGAAHPGRSGFKNSISLDQLAAERIGPVTRFPSLTTIVGQGNRTLSWTRSGAMIPGHKSPADLYRKFFVQGKPEEKERQIARLREGRSILDTLADRASSLKRRVGSADRERLDQYFTSVREVETRLTRAEEWEHKPKPKVAVEPPTDEDNRNRIIQKTRLMYDLIALALETDSTRIATVYINPASVTPAIEGVDSETHSLTHHGNEPAKIAELRRIEEAQFRAFSDFLKSLKERGEHDSHLLDQTMVLYGTCMGNANSHSNVNLPVLLAGGGFKHGQSLSFDQQNNTPLANLYVTMLQQLGLPVENFASSEGPLDGLPVSS